MYALIQYVLIYLWLLKFFCLRTWPAFCIYLCLLLHFSEVFQFSSLVFHIDFCIYSLGFCSCLLLQKMGSSIVTSRRRQWHPTPVLLPGKSHGWRSLVGCSPWGHEESDRTERLHFHFSFSCIGDGNGNPLQCYCLENPRDGGAWWAAVYGVTQSQT